MAHDYNRHSGFRTRTTALTTGDFLTAVDADNADWTTATPGGGTPSGTNTQTLYYNGTSLTATSAIRTDGTYAGIGAAPSSTNMLAVTATSSVVGLAVTVDSGNAINVVSTGANTGVHIDAGSTGAGMTISGASLGMSVAVTGTSNAATFARNTTGAVTLSVLRIQEVGATTGGTALSVDSAATSGNVLRCRTAGTTNEVFTVGLTETVVNEGSIDYDFRVEGDTISNLIFSDGSAEAVMMASTNLGARLNVGATSSMLGIFALATGSGESIAALNSGTGRAGSFSRTGSNASTAVLYVEGANAGDSGSTLDVIWAGGGRGFAVRRTSVEFLGVSTTEVIINDDGNSAVDFRVEGDTISSLLFTDASADAVMMASTNLGARLNVAATSSMLGIFALTTGAGESIAALNSGTGRAGSFSRTGTESAAATLYVESANLNDTGPCLDVFWAGTGRGFAVGRTGVEYLGISTTEVVINENGASTVAFRVEGDTLSNLFTVSGASDVVGVNNTDTGSMLNVRSSGSKGGITVDASGTGTTAIYALSTIAGARAGWFERNGTAGSAAVVYADSLNASDTGALYSGDHAGTATVPIIVLTQGSQTRFRVDTVEADFGLGAHGAITGFHGAEYVATGMSGATVTITGAIPAGAWVLSVVGRVTTQITGGAGFSGFDVGTGGDTDHWALDADSSVGIGWDSTLHTAGPAFYGADTDIVVTAKGNSFTAGALRLTVFYWEASRPTS